MNPNTNIPWVEKYRPVHFDDIVLSDINRSIFDNIIKTNHFPNLILYGPPGTGKTTTIMNLINKYQISTIGKKVSDLVIHLNASDERGIDVVRNQINQFVTYSTMFYTGMKFVILDEVDYMTNAAQQALKYLLQFQSNVRFCLICNYISRVDESLQTNFVKIRFNQLPVLKIVQFIRHISTTEGLNLTEETMSKIQKIYKSDIRSMINFIQAQTYTYTNNSVISDDLWETMYDMIKDKCSHQLFCSKIYSVCGEYNINVKTCVKLFMSYIIFHKWEIVTPSFVAKVEKIINTDNSNDIGTIGYAMSILLSI